MKSQSRASAARNNSLPARWPSVLDRMHWPACILFWPVAGACGLQSHKPDCSCATSQLHSRVCGMKPRFPVQEDPPWCTNHPFRLPMLWSRNPYKGPLGLFGGCLGAVWGLLRYYRDCMRLSVRIAQTRFCLYGWDTEEVPDVKQRPGSEEHDLC